MKPRDVLSCFFAGYGVYLTLTGLLGAASAALGLLALYRDYRQEIQGVTLVQYAFGMFPLLVGLLLVAMAGKLGAISARLARLEEGTSWDLQGSTQSLLAVLLAALGVYLFLIHLAELVRLGILIFMMKGAGPDLAELAARRLPDDSRLIVDLVCTLGGWLLASKSRVLASRLSPREKNG